MENQSHYQVQQPLPNATAVLVLGIISIVGCICYGIPGLVCGIISLVLGNKAVRMYEDNPSAYTAGSYSNAKAGRICAIIGLVISALFLLFVIFILATTGLQALSHPDDYIRTMEK